MLVFRLHLTMLGFPIVHDPLYNERDARPRLTLGDWEHHPEVVGALDRMEQQLAEDTVLNKRPVDTLDRTNQLLNEQMIPAEVLVENDPATEEQVNNLQTEEGGWLRESIGECRSDQESEIEEDSRFYDSKEDCVGFSEIEEDSRFAGLSQLANYKYCIQCQANHLLGTM